MSRLHPKRIIKLADKISALYSLCIITEAQKNEMAQSLRRGKAGLDALYAASRRLPEHPLVHDLQQEILFGENY